MNKPLKVLYVTGEGRSGSTLLGLILNRVPGFVFVGELCYIWQRGFLENQLCGDGKPFAESPFWQRVVARAFGYPPAVDPREMIAALLSVGRIRHMGAFITNRLPEDKRKQKEAYSTAIGKLYRAIAKEANAEVIIDSSKYPPYAFLSHGIPGIEVYAIHLIRDSRAVVFSWQRKYLRPEIVDRKQFMTRRSTVLAARSWAMKNLLAWMLKWGQGPQSMRVLYEEFVRDPQKEVARIMAFIGEDQPVDKLFDQFPLFEVGGNITIAGNPNRFKTGVIEIRPDQEWREKMPFSQKLSVTGLTFPLLVTYGYLLRR